MKTWLRILLPVAVLALGVLVTVALIKTRPEVKPAPRENFIPLVRVIAAEPQAHQFTVQAQGTVTPHLDINLVAEVPGRIVQVSPSFESGGFFEKGEELLTLETRDYELAVTRAQAQLAEAQVRLAREQAEADVAVAEWKTLGQGQASPLLRREPQLAEAKAAVASAQAALQQAELDLERCHINAPFAGRVWEKNVDAGQYVAKGTALARIYSVDFAEVRLPLPLEDLAWLDLPLGSQTQSRPGAFPEVTLRARIAGKPQEWQGKIVRTEAGIDPKTRMLTAVARVEDPFARKGSGTPLPIGLFVNAFIKGIQGQEMFLVPRAALRGRGTVLVVDDENRLRFRDVEVARAESERVLVSGGLHPGDRLCISVLEAPVDGMQVHVARNTPRTAIAEPAPATPRL